MSANSTIKQVAVAGFLGAVLVACAMPDDGDDPYSVGSKPQSGQGTLKDATCVSAIKGQDPGQFPTCKGTKGKSGRCIPADKIGIFGDQFETAGCTGGNVCLPDALVKSGTSVSLKNCTAGLAGEGRCFSSLVKDVVKNYDMLKGFTKDQCSGELDICVPCKNPLEGNKETGVCFDPPKEGECAGGDGKKPGGTQAPVACPYTGPALVDVKTLPQEDCGSGMRCVDAALLPSKDLANSLKKCAQGVCAPEKSVAAAGNYVPKTCTSVAGAEGRCTNVGVPQVSSQKDTLPKDVCDDDERCAPCFNPADGKATGACSTASCDAPKKPATTFPQCCGGRARCVPKASIPDAMEKNLNDDKGTCQAESLCVPTEYVTDANAKGASCAGTLNLILTSFDYQGVCVSDCVTIPVAGLIPQSTCGQGQKCAPCEIPLKGKTGAPGCPP